MSQIEIEQCKKGASDENEKHDTNAIHFYFLLLIISLLSDSSSRHNGIEPNQVRFLEQLGGQLPENR